MQTIITVKVTTDTVLHHLKLMFNQLDEIHKTFCPDPKRCNGFKKNKAILDYLDSVSNSAPVGNVLAKVAEMVEVEIEFITELVLTRVAKAKIIESLSSPNEVDFLDFLRNINNHNDESFEPFPEMGNIFTSNYGPGAQA